MSAKADFQVLNEEEAAAWLQFETDTLRKWRHFKKGPMYVKIGGGAVRYRTDWLDEWLAENVVETQQQKLA